MSKIKTLRNLFQIKILLKGSKPKIWRRVLVPSDLSLDKLHVVVQDAMGWLDGHLHQFICNDEYYGISDEFCPELKNEKKVKLSSFLKKEKDKIYYEYDFGDGWFHEITLEKVLPFEGNTKIRCIKGVRACPPEDCGGIYGYYHLLEVIRDENNPEYDDMIDWLGDDFDPEYFDLNETNKILEKI